MENTLQINVNLKISIDSWNFLAQNFIKPST